MIDHQDEFDDKNITKYMRVYWRQIMLHDLDEKIVVIKFSTLVEPKVCKIREEIIKSLQKDDQR